MLITISGLDGSGKTTLTKKIAASNSDSIYFCFYDFTLFGKLSNIFRKIMPNSRKNLMKKKYITKRENRMIGWLKKICFIIDIIRFKIFIFFNKNKIIICDRYFYDILIQGIYFGHFDKDFVKKVLGRIPTPDHPLLLDVPISIAINRAKKFDFEGEHFFRTKFGLYKDMRRLVKFQKPNVLKNIL